MAVVKNILVNIKARADKLAGGLNKASGKMAKFRSKMRKNFDKIGKAVNKARRKFKKFRKGLNRMFKTPIGKIAKLAAVVGGVLVLAAVNAIKTFAKFEKGLSDVAAVGGERFAGSMDKLKAKALELGKTTMFSASEAAAGMELMARAGFSANEVMEATPHMLNLAAAGSLELSEAADITAQVLRGMGMDVSETGRVVDVLAKAASMANTDVAMLGQAFSHVAPVAAALNISLEQTTAMLATLSDAGMQADRAGTGLKAVLSEMAGEIEARGVGALDDLVNSGLSVAEAFARFGKRGAPAILALIRMRERTGELSTAFADAEGAAEEMAETKMDNLWGSVKILQSAWENLNITLGEQLAPTIRVIVDVLAKFFTAASDAFGEVIGGGAESVVTAEGVIDAIFVVVDAFVMVWNVVKKVGAVISFVWNSARLIIARAIMAIVVPFQIMTKIVTEFLDLINVMSTDTADMIQSTVNGFVSSIGETVEESAKAAGEAWGDIWSEENDLDKFASQTKRNLKKSMKEVGKPAGEELAESVEEGFIANFELTEAELAIGEATVSLQEWIEKQTEAIELYGKTAAEIEIYKAAQAGVSEELINQAKALDEQMKALEAQESLMEKGKSLAEQMRTPTEVYSDRLQELQDMLNAGAISHETFERALKAAKEKLESASPEVEVDVKAGTVAASIDTAMGGFEISMDVQDRIAKDSLGEERKMVHLLEQISEQQKQGNTEPAMI